MSQKGFINIAVIIGVIVLIGVAGYFVVNRQVSQPLPTPLPTPSPSPTQTDKTTSWKRYSGFEVSRVITDTSHKVSYTELDTIKNLFQKNNIDLANLQVLEVTTSENYDKTTTLHINTNQFYQGIPIFNDRVTYHIKKTGEVESISGQPISNLNISIDPKISEYEGVKIARTKIVGGYKFTAELGLYRKSRDENFVLAWEIHTDNKKFPSQVAYIDANNGNLLYYFNGIIF